MRQVLLTAIVTLLVVDGPAFAAKRDIKGITTGMTLEQAVDAGRAQGGVCRPRPVPPAFVGQDFACEFADGFVDVMVTKLAKPARVYRVSEIFQLNDGSAAGKDKYKASVFDLYALKDRGEGHAKMSSGEDFSLRWFNNAKTQDKGVIVILDQDLQKAELVAKIAAEGNEPKP